MKYDIAAKATVDIGKELILSEFLGIEYESISSLEELPEETVSLRRSDFPLRVALKDGRDIIVLIEIQTGFSKDFVLRLIDYTVRFVLKYHLEVIPLVLVLTPSSLATGFYEDNVLTFKYKAVRFWEEKAKEFMDKIYLYPFLPLMLGGEDVLEEAEAKIYENAEISTEKKADLLTAMAIFAGLKDRELGIRLVKRRRDIMIQSPVYEFIKEEAREEGRREGREEGIKEGIKEGIREGIEEGKREGLYDAVALGLELKFGIDGIALMERVRKVESIERLEMIIEAIKIADKLEEVEKLI